jgi:hypothetical protein
MKLRTALVLLGVLVGFAAQASAQVAELRPAPSVLFRAEPTPEAQVDSLNIPPTYWKEGALVGGAILGVTGAVLMHGLCGMDGPDNCGGALIGGAILGFFLGAIPGALIGGQFPKSE